MTDEDLAERLSPHLETLMNTLFLIEHTPRKVDRQVLEIAKTSAAAMVKLLQPPS